jgi:hypothetical protein
MKSSKLLLALIFGVITTDRRISVVNKHTELLANHHNGDQFNIDPLPQKIAGVRRFNKVHMNTGN